MREWCLWMALAALTAASAAHAVPVTVTPTFPDSGWTANSGGTISFSGGRAILASSESSGGEHYVMSQLMYGDFTATSNVVLNGTIDAGISVQFSDGAIYGVHIGYYTTYYSFYVTSGGVETDYNSGVGNLGSFYYRLIRSGSTYETQVSSNDSSWTTLQTTTLAETGPAQLTLFDLAAQGGANASYGNVTATFDNGVLPEPASLALVAAAALALGITGRVREIN